MVKGFKELDPLLVINPCNLKQFSAYPAHPFETYDSTYNLLLNSLSVRKRINKLLTGLKKEHGSIQLYMPAFHPWNILFINWVSKQATCSSIVTIHDFITHSGESSAIVEKLQVLTVRKADQVITLSNYVKNQLVSKLGQADKCIVVPHPSLDAGTKNHLDYSATPALLFIGRVLKYKGLDNLVEAVKDLNIEKLTIAGKQKTSFKSASKNIEVIDAYLSENQIAELLATHHILVLPYLEASQSGILSMGIAAEMVMVISQVGGLSEQLPEEGAVWVEPTVDSLRQGIVSLMDNERRFAQVRRKVQEYNLKNL